MDYIEEIAPFTQEDMKKIMRYVRNDELYGYFLPPSREETELRTLATRYHKRCELYNRLKCSGSHLKTGEPIPITGEELRSVNQHRQSERIETIRLGRSMGFTEDQVVKAIRDYARGR